MSSTILGTRNMAAKETIFPLMVLTFEWGKHQRSKYISSMGGNEILKRILRTSK